MSYPTYSIAEMCMQHFGFSNYTKRTHEFRTSIAKTLHQRTRHACAMQQRKIEIDVTKTSQVMILWAQAGSIFARFLMSSLIMQLFTRNRPFSSRPLCTNCSDPEGMAACVKLESAASGVEPAGVLTSCTLRWGYYMRSFHELSDSQRAFCQRNTAYFI